MCCSALTLTHCWCTQQSITPLPHTHTHTHREARWLVATCWNAGLARLRLGDKGGAAPYLRSGLAMLRHAGGGWGGADRGAMEAVAAEACGAAVVVA